MAFYTIDKNRVFLTHKKYSEISKLACKEKSSEFLMFATMYDSKESEEKDNLINQKLKELYFKDKSSFINYWAEFEIIDEEAKENTWSILNAYCRCFGYSYMSELRDDMQQVLGSYTYDYRYPMGKVFSINHNVMPLRWWWKHKYGMTGRVIEIIIDIREVNKIVGTLKLFKLYTDNFILICGESELRIVPIINVNQ